MSHLGSIVVERDLKRGGAGPLSPAEASSTAPMLYQLHLLRAFAVLLVVLDHACLAISERIPVSSLYVQLAWLAGFLGVTIFFTISGYIMMETTAAQPASVTNANQFFRRRLLRIVPMYYLATALSLAVALGHGPLAASGLDRTAIAGSLLFIPVANARGAMEPLLAQGWTLNYEMLFYLLVACSLLLRPRARPLALAGLIVGCVGAAALAERWGYQLGPILRFWAAPIALNFVFGVLLAAYGRRRAGTGSPWLALALVAGSSVCLLGAVIVASRQPGGYVVVFDWKLDVAMYAASALSCWLCTRTNTPLPNAGLRGAVARLGVLLGDASYTTYLLHLFVIAVVVRLCLSAGVGMGAAMVASVLGAFAATVCVHRVVERPLLAWLRRPPAGAARRQVVVRHAR